MPLHLYTIIEEKKNTYTHLNLLSAIKSTVFYLKGSYNASFVQANMIL